MTTTNQRLGCSGHKPRNVSQQKLLEVARNGPSPRAFRRGTILLIIYFRRLASNKYISVVLIHEVVCGNLLQWPRETHFQLLLLGCFQEQIWAEGLPSTGTLHSENLL